MKNINRITSISQIFGHLDALNIARERTSQDNTVNNEGTMLLDMRKSNNLLILNGRCGDDKLKGSPFN